MIPGDSRFATNKDFFSDKENELNSPAGKAKIAKVQKLGELAKRLDLGDNQAALALAWCLKNKHVSTILLGATKPQQLKDNFAALEVLPKLTDEVMKEIAEILDNDPAPLPTYGREHHFSSQ